MNSNSLTVSSFSTCQLDFFFLVWTESRGIQVTLGSSCYHIHLFTTDHWNSKDIATLSFPDEAPNLTNGFFLGWNQVMSQWVLLLCFCLEIPCLHNRFQSNEVEHRSFHPGCILSSHDHFGQHQRSHHHKLWFSMVLATLGYIFLAHEKQKGLSTFFP